MCSVVQRMHCPNEQRLKGYGKSLLAAVCPAPSSLRTLLQSHASKESYPYRSHRCNQCSTCQSRMAPLPFVPASMHAMSSFAQRIRGWTVVPACHSTRHRYSYLDHEQVTAMDDQCGLMAHRRSLSASLLPCLIQCQGRGGPPLRWYVPVSFSGGGGVVAPTPCGGKSMPHSVPG